MPGSMGAVMGTFAAVMTGIGTGAIATIEVFGKSAGSIVRKIFKPAGPAAADFAKGKILLGTIVRNSVPIDQVTIGCEGDNLFAINCHGNPLIVADVMKLLEQNGATLISSEQLLYNALSQDKTLTTIAIEAKLTLPKAKTLEGSKIILNQTNSGLAATASRWLNEIDKSRVELIRAEAERILTASETARQVLFGCKVVIIGPPNTGKSTLLNHLSGREKAIVSEIRGTTRDWVTANCQIGPLAVEMTDTAGLAEEIAGEAANVESQEKAIEMLGQANLVLLVLDNSDTNAQLSDSLIAKLAGKQILTVLNKSDLPARFDPAKLANGLKDTTLISAKFGSGIDILCKRIEQLVIAGRIDPSGPICFTPRQQAILERLAAVKSQQDARQLTTELLNGRLDV